MITVQDFYKAYEGVPVVNGISFDVRPGEVLGLVGPNGAGKTTTMMALSGITTVPRGKLIVGGIDVGRDPLEVRRKVAWLPDTPQLYADLTIEEHISFTTSAFGIERDRDRALQLLESFDLIEHARKPAGELSRGMRQKLAVCCAFLRDPEVLIFDEPFTGLDPRSIHLLKRSISRLARGGAAVIVSSHLLAMVEDLCTHLLLLEYGEQRFFGPLRELRTALESNDELATLEDIFLLVTETQGVISSDFASRSTDRPPSTSKTAAR